MAVLGKIELADRDRLLVHRLTEALTKLADEIHTYNHPPVQVAEAKSWKVPPEAGDFEIRGGVVHHRYGKDEGWHDHPTMTCLMECIDSRTGIQSADIDPTDKESPS